MANLLSKTEVNTPLKVRLFQEGRARHFHYPQPLYHLNFSLSLLSKPRFYPPLSARRRENHYPLLPQAILRQRLWNTPKAKDKVERRKWSDFRCLKGPDRVAGGKHTHRGRPRAEEWHSTPGWRHLLPSLDKITVGVAAVAEEWSDY